MDPEHKLKKKLKKKLKNSSKKLKTQAKNSKSRHFLKRCLPEMRSKRKPALRTKQNKIALYVVTIPGMPTEQDHGTVEWRQAPSSAWLDLQGKRFLQVFRHRLPHHRPETRFKEGQSELRRHRRRLQLRQPQRHKVLSLLSFVRLLFLWDLGPRFLVVAVTSAEPELTVWSYLNTF